MANRYEFHIKATLRKDLPAEVQEFLTFAIEKHHFVPPGGQFNLEALFHQEGWELLFVSSAILDQYPSFTRRLSGYYDLELHMAEISDYLLIRYLVQWLSTYVAGHKPKRCLGYYRYDTQPNGEPPINLYVDPYKLHVRKLPAFRSQKQLDDKIFFVTNSPAGQQVEPVVVHPTDKFARTPWFDDLGTDISRNAWAMIIPQEPATVICYQLIIKSRNVYPNEVCFDSFVLDAPLTSRDGPARMPIPAKFYAFKDYLQDEWDEVLRFTQTHRRGWKTPLMGERKEGDRYIIIRCLRYLRPIKPLITTQLPANKHYGWQNEPNVSGENLDTGHD